MCYDISFTADVRQMSDDFPDLVFDVQISLDLETTIHILGHAYNPHPIIYKNKDDGLLHCTLMEWGIIPFYTTDKKAFAAQRAGMLNIRSERILHDKKSYWYKIRNRRCLIPMSGFYEHRTIKGLPKKVPYIIQLKDQPLLYMPGLYSVAEIMQEDGVMEKVWTFGLITREAIDNKAMQQIHNSGVDESRMPLLLPFELSERWVREDLTEETYREILNYEMPSAALEYKTVYTIRSPKARPDNKCKNEVWDWGVKVPGIVV